MHTYECMSPLVCTYSESCNAVIDRCIQVSEASVVACCFSPCGQMFVTGCTHGDLKLWDADVNLLCSERDAHDLGVTCCCFAPHFNVGECLDFVYSSKASVPACTDFFGCFS